MKTNTSLFFLFFAITVVSNTVKAQTYPKNISIECQKKSIEQRMQTEIQTTHESTLRIDENGIIELENARKTRVNGGYILNSNSTTTTWAPQGVEEFSNQSTGAVTFEIKSRNDSSLIIYQASFQKRENGAIGTGYTLLYTENNSRPLENRTDFDSCVLKL